MNTFGLVGILTGILLLFLIVACKTTQPTANPAHQTLIYELERTGCLGDCPVFRIQVYSNRLISIIPNQGLPVSNPTSDTLSAAEFESLRKSMTFMQSAELDSSYDNRVMDAPFAIIKMVNKEKIQTVTCRGDAPPAFNLGLQALENLAIKRDWLNGPINMAQSPKRELIMQLAEQEHVPLLEEKYLTYGLILKKKISPRQSLYLFSTTVSDHQSESLLNLLKEEPLVLEVQWNHQLKKRDE